MSARATLLGAALGQVLLFAAQAAGQDGPPPFAPPTDLDGEAVGPNLVRLTWTDSSPAPFGFRVERRASAWGIRQDRATDGTRTTRTGIRGQTFTAAGTRIDRIGFHVLDGNAHLGPIALSVELHEGAGFDGPLVASAPITGISDGYDGFHYADMGAATVTVGATYTARLVSQNDRGFARIALWRTFSGQAFATDPYAGGYGFEAGAGGPANDDRDFTFHVLVDPSDPWTTIATLPGDAREYLDTTVVGSTTYEYRVATTTPLGASSPGAAVQVLTPASLLASPSSVVASGVSPTRVDLTWVDQSQGEVEYRIERRRMHDALPGGARVGKSEEERFYAYVPLARAVDVARLDARDLTLLGASGHLATVREDSDNALLRSLGGRGWLGGNDTAVEGTWRWADHPEEDDVFFTASAPVGSVPWGPGQPDDGGAAGDEDFLYLDAALGQWFDHGPAPGSAVLGYYLEFGEDGQHPDFDTVAVLLPAGSTSFTDLTAAAGVSYEYRVVAVGPADDRAASAITPVRPPFGDLKAFVDGRENLYQTDWPGNPFGAAWPGHDGGGAVATPGAAPARSVRFSGAAWDFAAQGGAVAVTAIGRALDDGSSRTGPDGQPTPFRGLSKFALIGVWSSDPETIQPLGGPFLVGSAATLPVPATSSAAYLFLAENDGEFADNSGGYQVTLRVQAP